MWGWVSGGNGTQASGPAHYPRLAHASRLPRASGEPPGSAGALPRPTLHSCPHPCACGPVPRCVGVWGPDPRPELRRPLAPTFAPHCSRPPTRTATLDPMFTPPPTPATGFSGWSRAARLVAAGVVSTARWALGDTALAPAHHGRPAGAGATRGGRPQVSSGEQVVGGAAQAVAPRRAAGLAPARAGARGWPAGDGPAAHAEHGQGVRRGQCRGRAVVGLRHDGAERARATACLPRASIRGPRVAQYGRSAVARPAALDRIGAALTAAPAAVRALLHVLIAG